ncbi:YadA-like family protein [Bartonella sp. AU16XJBT]|uniref:YadA-like family protein n=1 Tax=Bartonella sp. AU16XJBT TaxID=3019088 RepID=UPI00235FACE0
MNDRIKEVSESVAHDSLLWSDDAHAFVARHEKSKGEKGRAVATQENSKITFLHAGDVSKDSTDAITGGQLYSMGGEILKYLGGGAKYENGQWTEPSFKIKKFASDGSTTDESYSSVAAAFEGVNSSFSDLHKEIKNEITNVKGDSLVKWDEEKQLVRIGGEKDGSAINIADKGNKDRILSGVKKAEKSNEAVNKAQLDENVDKLSKDIEDVRSVAVFYDYDTEEINPLMRSARKAKQTSVTFGNPKEGTVSLRNVGNGNIAKDSNEAVNGSQLFETNSKVSTYLGGDAKYENGQWAAPSFKVTTVKDDGNSEEKSYGNVAEALAGVGTSLTNVKNEITNEIANVKGDSLVKFDEKANLIKIGGEKEGTSISISDKDRGDRTLSGVKTATKDNEAVNKAQLDENVDKLSKDIEDVRSVAVFYDYDTEEDSEEINPLMRSARKAKQTSVTFGNPKEGTVSLRNVGNGNVAEASNEAVNGSQLHSLGDKAATYLGGSATFTEGVFTAPTYNISNITDDGTATEKSYSDVGSAFAGLDTSVKNVNTHLTNEIKNFNEKLTNITQEVQGDALLWNESEKAFVALHGDKESKTSSRITSLAAGSIASGSSDAVTGGQLHTITDDLSKILGGTVSFDGESFKGPKYDLSTVSKDGKVDDKTYEDVGLAFKGLDDNIQIVNDRIKEVSEGVAHDSLLWNDEANAFVARHEKSKGEKSRAVATQENSKITFLLDGDVSKDSTDAITGGQLYSMSNTLATYFGGGAEYKDGQWTDPSFKVKQIGSDGDIGEESYNNVADALSGVGSSFKSIHDEISTMISDSLVKQEDKTNRITVGAETGGGEINIANKNKEDRTLSGVKKAENDNEAVNKGQLDKSLKDLSDNLQSDESAVVHYDKKDGENGGINYTSVTLGKGKDSTAVGLHNVADGSIASGSSDAVTGGQLYTLGSSVAKSLGGEASYESGKWVAPSFKVKTVKEDGSAVEESSYDDIVSAFAGVGTSFENLQKEVTQSNTEVTENIKQNALLWSDSAKAFVAQHGEKDGEKTNSKITSLQNGEISEHSTDAVTGGQIYSLNKTVASYFGGGAGYNDKGEWAAPSFKLKTINSDGTPSEEKSYDNVADAFADVSSSFTNIKNDITNVVSDSLVKQDAETKVIKIGGEKDGAAITIADKDSKSRTLSGVKEAEQDDEAVNKGQLDKNVTKLSDEIKEVRSAAVFYDYDEEEASDDVRGFTRSARKVNKDSVTFGDPSKGQVALHNVADGKIAKDSHDVINGNQIDAISQDVAKFLGGDAKFSDGTFTDPTYKLSKISTEGKVEEGEFKDVGTAFEGLDTSVKNVNQRIKDVSESVSQDSLNWSNDKGAFVAQHGEKDGEKTASKITSLADGSIASGSSDAVNGGQIYSLNQTLAKYFGGEMKYEDDEWSEPTFTLKTYNADGTEGDPQEHHNVAEAFAGIDKNVQNIVKDFNEKVTNITESVQGDALLWDKTTGAFVAQHGEKDGEKTASKITSLADGSIASGSSDAVNGGQIYDLNQSLATYFGGDAKYVDGEWSLPGFKIMTFQEDGSFEEEDYDSIAAAFAGINKVFKNLHNEISDNIEQNALLWSDDAGAFVAQHGEEGKKDNSKITFLAEGKISEDSTDAINGGQIYTLQQSFASYFGGGAGYDKEGNWQAPTFYVQAFNEDGTKGDKEERKSVSEAFDVVNDSMSTINDRIKEVEKDVSSNGLNWNEKEGSYDASHADDQGVKSPSKIINVEDGKVDEDSKEAVNGGQLWKTQQMITDQVKDIETKFTEGSVQYDKDADGNKTNKVTLVGGDDSSPVLIDNVADGKIENGSKEAVNGGQLHDYTEQQMKTVLEDAKKYTDKQVSNIVKDGVNEANSYTDMKFETLNYAVEDVRKEARQAAAIGLAVSNLRYYDIPGSLSVSFGSGLWRSQSAFAIGAGYTSEDGNIRSNVSITSAGGHWGIGAGITLRLR